MKGPQWLTLVVIVGVLAFVMADAMHRKDGAAIVAARDTVRIADSVRVSVHDTVTKYLPRADSAKKKAAALDRPVTLTSDSTITITRTDTVITQGVPPELVADVRQLRFTVAVQDSTIGVLRRQSAADSLRIVARDKLIALQKPPRKWGFGVTAGPGCGRSGCEPWQVTAGLSWRP